MKIAIASDHAGFDLKELVKQHFADIFEFEDFGTHSPESVDYPDFAHPLADWVSKDPQRFGILICGTGNGMIMAANKHDNIRAGLCWCPDIAALARQHNNANILVMPARFIPVEVAFSIVEKFFNTEFEGGRHQRRVEKINLNK